MNANSTAPATARQGSIAWALPALLVAGLALRVLYIGNEGFKSDVSTYMSWALSLSERPFSSFYSTVGFADYPPGYFYILAIVGHFWHAFFASRDHGFAVLRVLVKVPAILADLGIGVLLYGIVKRFASTGYALGAAALYLLNPGDDLYLGSVGAGRLGRRRPRAAGHLRAVAQLRRGPAIARPSALDRRRLAGFRIFAAHQAAGRRAAAFDRGLRVRQSAATPRTAPRDRRGRRRRDRRSPCSSPNRSIPAIRLRHSHWLWDRYAYGAGVYSYNSVNAFNLWALRGTLWVPDNQYILLLPQALWGLLLVAAAVALVVWRYVQDRTDQSLLEGCAVAALAFFVLATRMHERYLFNGVLFTIACLPFARRYLWGAVALSVALLANLIYSLQYLLVVTHNVPGTNAQNLWGLGTTFFSAVVVLTFFWLGYFYLGSGETVAVAGAAQGAPGTRRRRSHQRPARGTGSIRAKA